MKETCSEQPSGHICQAPRFFTPLKDPIQPQKIWNNYNIKNTPNIEFPWYAGVLTMCVQDRSCSVTFACLATVHSDWDTRRWQMWQNVIEAACQPHPLHRHWTSQAMSSNKLKADLWHIYKDFPKSPCHILKYSRLHTFFLVKVIHIWFGDSIQ